MALDPVTNFAKVTVSTTYDASATSIVLSGGNGALLPDPGTAGAFNLVWFNSTDYPDPADDPNKEIVRCTARSTDTLTVTRAQEGTSASTKNTGGKTYKMILAVTKKMIDDLSTNFGKIAVAASNTTFTSGTVVMSASGGAITINSGAQSVGFSVPQTSSLVGVQGISLSTNGSTISIGRSFQSEYVPFIPISTASQTLAVLGATSASARFFPMDLSDNIAFNVLSLMHNLSYATSSVSGQQTVSYLYGLYTNNGNSLSLISSNSFSLAVTNSSISHTVSYPVSTGTGGYTYTTLTQNATANIQSFWGTAAAGRPIGLQFGNSMTLSSGDYWLGLLLLHSSSSANIGISIAVGGNANPALNNLAGIGQASSAQRTNFSIRYGNRGLGAYTVSQSTLPNGVPLSQISMTQTIMPLYSFLST